MARFRQLQFRGRKATYLLNTHVGFLLLCLFFTILFFILGCWQLHRYEYKKNLLAVYHARLSAVPVEFTQDVAFLQESNHFSGKDAASVQFKVVTVRGVYDNALTMLVQNRFYHDKIGFEVLTPLRIKGEKKLLLVDRGWIAEPSTSALPTIETVTHTQEMTGHLKLQNEYQFILGKNILNPTVRPLVIQKIDFKELDTLVTPQGFYPFILQLGGAQPHGYVRDWTITTVPPERHMGYAVQWFAMMFVLIIAYLCFSCERVNENKK